MCATALLTLKSFSVRGDFDWCGACRLPSDPHARSRAFPPQAVQVDPCRAGPSGNDLSHVGSSVLTPFQRVIGMAIGRWQMTSRKTAGLIRRLRRQKTAEAARSSHCCPCLANTDDPSSASRFRSPSVWVRAPARAVLLTIDFFAPREDSGLRPKAALELCGGNMR